LWNVLNFETQDPSEPVLGLVLRGAPMPIYMNFGTTAGDKTANHKVLGMNQGMRKIAPWNVSHTIQSPRDIGSGQVKGRRLHEPLTITTEVDVSSARFFVLNQNKVHPKVHFDFVKTDGEGKLSAYFSITLTNGCITRYVRKAVSGSSKYANMRTHEVTEIEFSFEKIDIQFKTSKKSSQDDWDATT
jgi:type VI secretion system secreted protein Hcp